MSPHFSSLLGPRPVVSADASSVDQLQAPLSALYTLTQSSPNVFASPLGPFAIGTRQTFLPRFMFFGPHASDASWRLCCLAGFDPRDLRPSRAVLALVELLAQEVETAHGLNLSIFPLVDTAALRGGPWDRRRGEAHWGRASTPEIRLLEQDARLRGYHGFIRVETADPDAESAVIAVRGVVAEALTPDLELIAHEEAAGIPVRFERSAPPFAAAAGPLSIEDDLPFAPFELSVRIPRSWSDRHYPCAAAKLLRRFLWRYRAFQAYGQNL
jgi:hypothetical protein